MLSIACLCGARYAIEDGCPDGVYRCPECGEEFRFTLDPCRYMRETWEVSLETVADSLRLCAQARLIREQSASRRGDDYSPREAGPVPGQAPAPIPPGSGDRTPAGIS